MAPGREGDSTAAELSSEFTFSGGLKSGTSFWRINNVAMGEIRETLSSTIPLDDSLLLDSRVGAAATEEAVELVASVGVG